MDSESLTLIFILVILISLSAFFSGTETAYSSLSRARLKNAAQDGVRHAKTAYKLSENYDRLLTTILIGNNIVNIASATLATLLFVKYFPSSGATISTLAMTIIVLVFGEVTPKSLAKENPEAFAMKVAPVMSILVVVFKPFIFLLVSFKKFIAKIFKVTSSGGITENELLTLVDEAEQVGGINKGESELIRNAIEFNDLEAIDIITPRTDVSAIDITATNSEIAELFKETGYSRIPIYEETIDSIVGVINEKDFHNFIFGTDNTIEVIMKSAEFIPPSIKISELLRTLQKNKSHLAIVVDEFGGTEGIVTLEDILEELVGEIWDEHDEIDEEIKDLGYNKYLVPTSMDLDDLFEKFIINEETDASTVNGWIIQHIDKIPDINDTFDSDNLTVKVTRTQGLKAEEILVTVNFEKIISDEDDLN